MLSIQDPLKSKRKSASLSQHPFLQLAFRASFLFATTTSIFALIFWFGYLNAWWQLNTSGLTPIVWHLHEMLFGYGATVATGFVLTAVQTWTGRSSIKGLELLALLSVWLIARVLFFINSGETIALAIIMQCIWWLVVIGYYTKLVVKEQNRRNYLFIIIFTLMMILELSILLLDVNGYKTKAMHLGRTMVLLFCLLMAIVGGRVIPFFTKAGARLTQLTHPKWLDKTLLCVSIVGALMFFSSGLFDLPLSPAWLMLLSGLLHVIRLSFWQGHKTLTIPLLWSLHLSYLALAIGLILLGLSYLVSSVTFSAAIHLLTIGAMGLMILSMMSRISLGHTGRLLQSKPIISLAFALMTIAALSRTLLPLIGFFQLSWQLSTASWVLASIIFLWVYTPILTAPNNESRN